MKIRNSIALVAVAGALVYTSYTSNNTPKTEPQSVQRAVQRSPETVFTYDFDSQEQQTNYQVQKQYEKAKTEPQPVRRAVQKSPEAVSTDDFDSPNYYLAQKRYEAQKQHEKAKSEELQNKIQRINDLLTGKAKPTEEEKKIEYSTGYGPNGKQSALEVLIQSLEKDGLIKK